ncbi:Na+/H+ antiporter NhaA [Solitalea sp. MAHUQ-68]|uniref:Na(+)/H(+) antiporter NhaA n=1 Tax=Solitalea agri TaxID=2953739 RepID=A0A9X2EZ17_9SPHI|nr:Na+/H+ antiporter NhaA [Solitalea agri]MCO4291662.1 Na+/H+ antiporter NhaA [Solitalea agri]
MSKFTKSIFKPFAAFLKTEQASGVILIFCTVLSLLASNSSLSEPYLHFWHQKIGMVGFGAEFTLSIEHWINDGLMVIFFLVVGLEIKRELLKGELSSVKKATLPMVAALGGMVVPAVIYFLINKSTPTEHGWGIPMATDIAFALGILSLLGKRVPISLKVFLTALAVVDDLGAILVIAVAYTQTVVLHNLYIALSIFAVLMAFNYFKIRNVLIYLLGGVFMWYFMLQSGVHATIAGVLLAITIPLESDYSDHSPAEILEHNLHQFSSFIIMPLFALANTCIVFKGSLLNVYGTELGLGIILGLLLGKPLGIAGFSFLAIKSGMATMPSKVSVKKVIGTGFLGGIGFTMSIFISILAFVEPENQNFAKIAVLSGSVLSGLIGYLIIYQGSRTIHVSSQTNETLVE